jgi:hypothetical protein
MELNRPHKITSLVQLYNILPDNERLILDILRQLVIETLPKYCKEKISFNVPYFYGNKGICIIWPASIPRGGITEGVLFGFWQGKHLKDVDNYLTHGTNKKIYYKIFKTPAQINIRALKKLLKEAIEFDNRPDK